MAPIAATHVLTQVLPAVPQPVLWDELVVHRDYLVHFARHKLQDPALAEDLVHDVFEAVASGHATFAGRSALRSWLTGILKHKIVDLARQRSALVSLDEDIDSSVCHSLECPQPQPDELAQQRQTLRLVLHGIAKLPQGLCDVMQLRVLQDQSSAQVCEVLAITENNMFQRLFKARQSLAASLAMTIH